MCTREGERPMGNPYNYRTLTGTIVEQQYEKTQNQCGYGYLYGLY